MTSFNEGSIHNQFACHVLHIISIKPSSTAQSWISPGLSTHTVNPTLSPLSQSLTHSLSVSLLSPFSLTVPVYAALISDPWHVNNNNNNSSASCRNEKSLPRKWFSVQLWHFHLVGTWLLMLWQSLRCWNRAWSYVYVSDLSIWPLMRICSVYLLADLFLVE